MASDQTTLQFLVDQIAPDLEITYRKMFGEYAIYSRGKVVALVCDNQLYVKPTAAGKEFIGEPRMAPAYTGARPSFSIGEQVEDREWLSELLRITEKSLPEVQKRKEKVRKKQNDKK